jgi:hypothetical protein
MCLGCTVCTYVCGCVRVSVQVCVLGLIRVCVQKEKNIDLVLSFPQLSLDLAVLLTPLNFFLSSVIETAEFDLA